MSDFRPFGTVSAEYSFPAAHRLPLHPGKCRNPHGHNYVLRVHVSGPVLEERGGMVIDFFMVDAAVKSLILDQLDHSDLNKLLENPTAENLAVWMWDRLDLALPGLSEIQLWEEPRYCFTYRGERR